MEIKTVCVCGAGTMGSGIAQVFVTAGYDTILFDVSRDVLEKGVKSIESALSRDVERGKLSVSQKQQSLQRLTAGVRVPASAEVFIEAIVENFEAKVALFTELMKSRSDEVLFCSNTSSLSLTEMARQLPYKENLLGLHFFNPAPVMKLVEVVKTEYTSDEVLQKASELVQKLGKTMVVCKDAPGFVVNRVARPFYLEALRIAEEQQISFECIDSILEAQGFKMGPFKLMDLIGNDINYAVSTSVYQQLKYLERLKPSVLQEE
ncbi:MAG TPA: 3-hydroxyacyl-CoA dehydrogenase NAD-binding domain-containing protein, partial [Chitinophagaceae bacterium]|nr:3-hydroxyacyl-CoA dehydrogenase NAD-binding domain-containing protein [Chitinophagaceae bacterium]